MTWCEYKRCSCDEVDTCKTIQWINCNVKDYLSPDAIPIIWLNTSFTDNPEVYKVIQDTILPTWRKYWDRYNTERERSIKENE